MQTFFKKNRELLWLLAFPALSLLYFATQHLPLAYHAVHIAADDLIPFLPVFIIPYILWYAYIPVLLLTVYALDRRAFLRQAAVVFSGMFLGIAVFVLYPTCIDFRPDAAGDGVLLALCRIIYANDAPVNVFPSLHCFEAVAVHLTAFPGGPLRDKLLLRVCSAVFSLLACLSTVFVKQHSLLDGLAGCALAALLFALSQLLRRRRGGAEGNP